MESSPETTTLSFDEQKKEARGYGIAAAICAFITALSFIPFAPLTYVAGVSLLGLVGTGWKLLFHGSTAISMQLQGTRRLLFQIFISIVTPILFSIYFIKEAQSITLEGMYVYMFHAWILFPIGIFAYVSFIVANYLDRYHPFRGFIIASTIFFVLCLIGHHGIRIGSNDDAYGYNDSDGIEVLDTESKALNKASGKEVKLEDDREELVAALKEMMKWSPERRKEFMELSSEEKKEIIGILIEMMKWPPEQRKEYMELPPEEKKEYFEEMKAGKLIKENKKQSYPPYTSFSSQDEYDRHKEKVKNGYFLYMYIIYVVTSYTFMFLGLCWNRRTIKMEQKKYYKEILDAIYASIKIVSDYGAILKKTSEEGFVFVPESRLPHSKEKIINAIRCVELFIEKALSDESLKKNFFLHPAAVFFDKTGAEYIFSEKYRKSLKVGLIYLVAFVSDELAEKLRKSTIVMDYMDKKGIKSTDNLTAEEWEEFRRVVGEAFKL